MFFRRRYRSFGLTRPTLIFQSPDRGECDQNLILHYHDAVLMVFFFFFRPVSADCRINGRLISLGEPVVGVARSSCETCFCINGQVRCDKVICPPIRAQIAPNCGPVYSDGHCCPTSYNCTAGTYPFITLAVRFPRPRPPPTAPDRSRPPRFTLPGH